MDIHHELAGLVDALDKNGIDYAVCGGIAVALHGYSRFTKDIDLLVREEDVDAIKTIASKLGFLEDAGAIAFDKGAPNERVVHRISKIEANNILTLDLIQSRPAFEDVWTDRELFQWQDGQIQVVSANGLAKMKRLAGRDQDLLDIKQLGLGDDQE